MDAALDYSAEQRVNTSVTSILQLADARGRIILFFYGAGNTFVAILNLNRLINPALGIIALLLMWTALVILARPGAEPFDIRLTLSVIALSLAITFLGSWNMLDTKTTDYASWHLGVSTFLLLFLALRGRRLMAWLAYISFASIVLVAGVTTDRGASLALNDVLRQAATLLIGTLFAMILRRTSRTITALQETQLQRTTAEAAMAAATAERALQTGRLERVARPALTRILDDEPFSQRELNDFVLLEATLRDGIRAAGFSSERLTEETRLARERGLQVVLLDDRGGDLLRRDRVRVEDALVKEYHATKYGTITARLSPHGRDDIATIVVDEVGHYRRIVVKDESAES